jgi:DNA-binding LacI/PurR family transcriptional regulator
LYVWAAPGRTGFFQEFVVMKMGKTEEPRYMKLRRDLYEFIENNPPGAKLPSYRKMIRRYGMGQATIDQALRELDERKLIVREHKRGIFISSRAAQKNIGVIFGRDIFNFNAPPVSQMVLKYAEDYAEKHGESISFFINTRQVMIEDHGIQVNRDLLDALNSGKLDRLLLFTPRGPSEVNWLAAQNLPFVVITNCPGKAYGVTYDIGEVVRLGARALAERGCQRIALLTLHGHQRYQGFSDDLDAYREVLDEYGLEQRGGLIWDDAPKPPEKSPEFPVSNEEVIGRRAAEALLGQSTGSSGLPFDGLVSTDDRATAGFVGAIREFGIQPGEDLRIATHANRGLPVLRENDQALIRVEVDSKKLIHEAFSVLRKLDAGELAAPGISKIKPRCKAVTEQKQYDSITV